MIEFAFVWIGIGALVFLFLSAALGNRPHDTDRYANLFVIVLIFMAIWPLILIPMYQDRKNFKF